MTTPDARSGGPDSGMPGALSPLVDETAAAAAVERLRTRLGAPGPAGPDAEMLAQGASLAAHLVEAGRPGFHAFAFAVATVLQSEPGRLRPHLRGWYEGARTLLEDHGRDAAQRMDPPEAVRSALAELAGFDSPAPAPAEPGPEPEPYVEPSPAPSLSADLAPPTADPAPTFDPAPPAPQGRESGPGNGAPVPASAPAAAQDSPPAWAPDAADAADSPAPAAAPAPAAPSVFGDLSGAESAARAGRAASAAATQAREEGREAEISAEDYALYTGAGRRKRRREEEGGRKVAVRRSDMLWGAFFPPAVMGGFAVFLLLLVTPPISWLTGLSRWQVFVGVQALGFGAALWLLTLVVVLPPVWYAMNRSRRGWIVAIPVALIGAALFSFVSTIIVVRSPSHPDFMATLFDWAKIWTPVICVCAASVALGPHLRKFNRRAFKRLGAWYDSRFGGAE